MYDVFISYRRDGGYAMARLMYEHLKQKGLNPFFDLEELRSGPFNVRLYKAIEECTNFLLVLPANALDRCSSENDWLRLEITHAIAKDKNIVPLMMEGFAWPEILPDGMEKLPSYNGVQMSRDYFDASVDKIIGMLKGVSVGSSKPAVHINQQRSENTYFSSADKREIRRLRIQQNLMKQFDQPVYDSILARYPGAKILDVGSNNGDFIMDRMVEAGDVEKLIGLEYDQIAVDTANRKYGEEGRIAFYCANVESSELEFLMDQIMEENDIDRFDIINISMVILHLKNPYKLLKTLRAYLRRGGTVIIKDIDDGLNLAYPDDGNNFQRVFDICNQNEDSGFRQSGRQIYTLLRRAGYRDVCLEKSGLSTAGMDYEERSALFDVYFSFVLEDLKLMAARYPEDKRVRMDLEWYSDYYDDLEQQFQDDAFFFNLGFTLHTAQR